MNKAKCINVHLKCIKNGGYVSAGKARRGSSFDVCVQQSWQMLTGESPVVVKIGQPLSQ